MSPGRRITAFRFPLSGAVLKAAAKRLCTGPTATIAWMGMAVLTAVFIASCSDATKTVAPTGKSLSAPAYAIITGGNGLGVCMGDDAFASGVTTGMGSATDLNCTANDISIASATVTAYRLFTRAGTYTPLSPGTSITCNQGDTIYAITNAILQNSAQSRYNVGIWIATDGGTAVTGSCVQFTLNTGSAGVFNLDNNACGDMKSGITTTVPLDTLTLTCEPSAGTDSLRVGACLGWKNSSPSDSATAAADCPVAGNPDTRNGFAWGTVPETKSKCNCGGFTLPIIILKTAKLEVKKVCSPTTDPGTFDLLRDDTVQVNNGVCGSTTGAVTVTAGTSSSPGALHTFGEGDFTTANYTSAYSCVNRVGGASRGSGTRLSPDSITLQPNDDVICTFTNTRKPTLTVNKVCAPTSDAGHFNLRIDGSTAGTGADAACGGTTGAVVSTIGAHTVSETAGTATDLTNYTTVISGDCSAAGAVTLAAGDNKVCTITNTRKPTLTVNKVCSPTNDTGLFNLQIDGSTAGTGTNAACGGTTGAVISTIGSHTAGETAGTNTSLTDYITVISGDCAANGSVTLAAGDNKTCTITNTRKATLTVNKVCVPTSDAGAFNLQIDGSTAGTGANAACGGTTGAVVVSAASHTVGETQGTGTLLSNYSTVISGDCAADGTVSLTAGQNKTCTITNTRKPTLTVNKVCVPTNDTGLFNLQIDGGTAGTGANAACGGTTGAVISTIGSHTAGETAGTNTNLANYTSVISGDCAADGSVTLAAGDNKTCTITNTHKATLTVNKVCSPTSDAGAFNLRIDGSTAGTGANAACGGTTGAVDVSLASHTVSETAGTATDLSNYNTVIGGDCAADGTVSITAGQNKTCTITNTRKPTLTVNKVCVPTSDPGLFNLRIDGSTAGTGADAACGGTTGAVISTIGGHTVSETAGTSTDLTNYVSVISGDCAANGSVTLAAGDNKTCTITNSRKATLIVDKVTVGGGTQLFDFSETGISNFQLADATTPLKTTDLLPGNYTVCELGLAVAWSATATVNGSPVTLTFNNTTGDGCRIIALAYGDSTTIVITNTPPPTTGSARTIGYWKNWSSCATSNGGQYLRAIAKGMPEATLNFYLGGAGVQSIYPIGTITALTCEQAVNLLSKNAIDGTSRAGDPIYNMVAQLLGARLNVAAGVGTCSALTTALSDAQTLLLAINPQFNGLGSYKKTLTAAQVTQANTLNGILDSYNNNTLCP